jgi:predicted amidophosphoribosyltransferase
MDTHRKRYCRHCGERISRASRRCQHCRRLTLRWKDYLVVGVVALILLLLMLRYLGVFHF